jgi:hypothetical protein
MGVGPGIATRLSLALRFEFDCYTGIELSLSNPPAADSDEAKWATLATPNSGCLGYTLGDTLAEWHGSKNRRNPDLLGDWRHVPSPPPLPLIGSAELCSSPGASIRFAAEGAHRQPSRDDEGHFLRFGDDNQFLLLINGLNWSPSVAGITQTSRRNVSPQLCLGLRAILGILTAVPRFAIDATARCIGGVSSAIGLAFGIQRALTPGGRVRVATTANGGQPL